MLNADFNRILQTCKAAWAARSTTAITASFTTCTICSRSALPACPWPERPSSLLIARRLYGLRGGGKAERAEHEEDTGWAPIERATPVPLAPQERKPHSQQTAPRQAELKITSEATPGPPGSR